MVLTDMTVNALATATDSLHGVMDKAGKPMISHAIAVAESMPDEISTVVALLHDVLEDSSLTRHSLIPQRSERSRSSMLVLLPSECRESKVRYPAPWGGKGGFASWVQGLPWGY